MGFLTNFFSNIKNKFTNKKNLPAPGAININVFSDAQKEEDELVNSFVNASPTPHSIHTNIATKQSMELSYLLDMAYVAATADDSFYLPHPYIVHHSGKNAQMYEEIYNKNLEFTNEYFQKNIETSRKLDMHSKPRFSLLDDIRTVYPDFFHSMDKKISQDDYVLYRKNKTELRKCLSCSSVSYSEEKLSEEVLLSYKDNLAKLIDSLDFSRACQIEDTFVLSELEMFFQKLSELSVEEQRDFASKEITIKEGQTVNILDFVSKMQNERISRLEKYSTIENLYNKLENQSKLKLKIKEVNNENTEHIHTQELHNNYDDEIR